jgi:hypothetical protein
LKREYDGVDSGHYSGSGGIIRECGGPELVFSGRKGGGGGGGGGWRKRRKRELWSQRACG